MTILHTEEMGVRGGQSTRVLQDMELIQELGWRPILACKIDNWLGQEALRRGFETIDFKFRSYFDIQTLMQLRKTIKQHRIDIVHTHSSIDSYLATYVAKMLRKKIIRSRHSELTKSPNHLYRIADAIVTTGEKIRQELIRHGVDQKKVVSIPSCPDSKIFQPDLSRREQYRQKHHLQNCLVLGTMGGVSPGKRVELLIELLPRLLEKNSRLFLLVAGDDHPALLSKMNQKIHRLNVDAHVKFIGYVDPVNFLDAIDIYVCPSKKEGIPQALMQAMMMGKPCVSTNVGSIEDLDIRNNLLLTDKEDLEGLYTHLEKLICDDKSRNYFGNLNRNVATKYFSRDVMREKTKKMYESVMGKNSLSISINRRDTYDL